MHSDATDSLMHFAPATQRDRSAVNALAEDVRASVKAIRRQLVHLVIHSIRHALFVSSLYWCPQCLVLRDAVHLRCHARRIDEATRLSLTAIDLDVEGTVGGTTTLRKDTLMVDPASIVAGYAA